MSENTAATKTVAPAGIFHGWVAKTCKIAGRELAGYFYSPVAYLIVAIFLAASAVVFLLRVFIPGEEASLRGLFEWMALLMVLAAPLLTMRLISDEYHRGTVETLLTAPVTDTQVILGKYAGVMGFYIVLLASTAVFLVPMAIFGRPDPGLAAMGYLGMVLLGGAYLAVGVFASSLTRYQIVAAVVSAAILCVFALLMKFIMTASPEPWNHLAGRLNTMAYFRDFSRGIFDTRGAVYFLSAAALFLFLSVKTLESRRWR